MRSDLCVQTPGPMDEQKIQNPVVPNSNQDWILNFQPAVMDAMVGCGVGVGYPKLARFVRQLTSSAVCSAVGKYRGLFGCWRVARFVRLLESGADLKNHNTQQ